jgi:probable HAF family extracellular repeat protein
MLCSNLRPLYRLVLCALVTSISVVPMARAQIQASCTFKVFPFNFTVRSGETNVNDWGTVVGEAINPGKTPPYTKAFVRYSGGGTSYFSAPGALTTKFNARNNKGVSVGEYSDASNQYFGFMLQGPTFIPIEYPGKTSGLRPNGINKFGSIVGTYLDNSSGTPRGFKRYSNGGFIRLDYPGAQSTYPMGINDNGVVVGWYNNFDSVTHGFIYSGGKWATLDKPMATSTQLDSISNAGVIAGFDFIYANSTFITISVPNSSWTGFLNISPLGLITGQTAFSSNPGTSYGFTATCQ